MSNGKMDFDATKSPTAMKSTTVSASRIDVAIVGAGFAGAVAARELTGRGYSTVILEARSRIGGRTLTRDWHGRLVDLGGQWIHWLQPHIWTEVTRYGLPLYEREPIDHVAWITDGAVKTDTFEAFHDIYLDAWTKLYAGAMQAFPRPHDPLAAIDRLRTIDDIPVGDRIKALGLSGGPRDIVRAIASVQFNAPCEVGALTQGLRRLAMVGGDPDLLAQSIAQYRIATGTSSLLSAILADSSVRIELSTIVRRIVADADGVDLLTTNSQRYRAAAAIVTVPINTLKDIEFTPGLSGGKRAMASEGQATRGAMYWLRLANVPTGFLLLAPPEHPLTFVRYDAQQNGAVLANAFAPEAGRIGAGDGTALEGAVRRWLPDAKLIDYIFHDWVADPFSQQTWTMLKPGQLTSHFADLQRSEGRIFFAGADYASGWFGFIDGAIQSAYVAVRDVGKLLPRRRPGLKTIDTDQSRGSIMMGKEIPQKKALTRVTVDGQVMPWSKGVVAGNLVFLSGIAGDTDETGMPALTIEEQTRIAFDRANAALAEAGSSLEHAVRISQYISDRSLRPRYIAAREAWLTRHAPSLVRDRSFAATVLIQQFVEESMLVEIEVTALRS